MFLATVLWLLLPFVNKMSPPGRGHRGLGGRGKVGAEGGGEEEEQGETSGAQMKHKER